MTPFVTIVADPPWRYGDKLRMGATKRSADDVYKSTMSTDEVCALATTPASYPVGRSLAACTDVRIAGHSVAVDAFLWLWVTNPFLLNGDGVRVCHAWGFEPKQLITWVKSTVTTRPTGTVTLDGVHFGMGHYTRGCTEHIILATRGRATSLVKVRNERNLILAPAGRHSEKPEASYALIERVTPGPYLELFARKRRPGWTAWGNELPEAA